MPAIVPTVMLGAPVGPNDTVGTRPYLARVGDRYLVVYPRHGPEGTGAAFPFREGTYWDGSELRTFPLTNLTELYPIIPRM